VSMAKWARFCISTIARRCQVARSKAGSCEVYAFHGLSRVDTTPIRFRACRRHIFLKFSNAGAEVPVPCTKCCRKKPRNFMDPSALVHHSLQDGAHQLIQLLCHHCTVSSRLRQVHKMSRPWTAAGYNGPYNCRKTCLNIFSTRIRPLRGWSIATGPCPCTGFPPLWSVSLEVRFLRRMP
jgi:hypothetical protein